MAQVPAFHSINEVKKPVNHRVYHNNNTCPPGRDIPSWERKPGPNTYRPCEVCATHNRLGQ